MHTARQQRKLRVFLSTKEAFMMLLVASSLALVAVEHFMKLTHEQLIAIELYEVAVAIIFIAEFVFEWYHAKNRQLYIRYHWFYLFAAIPIPIESLELLRGIRALRLIKIAQAFSHLRYEHNTHLFSRSSNQKKV